MSQMANLAQSASVRPRVIVIVEGGNVQGAWSNIDAIDIEILDHDNFECVRDGEHDDDCEDHVQIDVDAYNTLCLDVETMEFTK